jgi:putative ABC transport system permease protein
MKDPHPLRMQIAPSDSISPWNILVEVRDEQPEAYKKQLDQLYSKIIDGYPFDSEWYDTLVQKIYEDITRMNHLILIFTCAALVISLLGLTAMSIYFIAQRKRDIAVRKVFGSDSRSEMLRLMKFSSASLAVSLLIGLPLMYIGIQQIDKIVTYESSFPWWVPVAAFLIVALISLASVWLISRKAVRENPVLNLKTE